jgi:hypothetical protein
VKHQSEEIRTLFREKIREKLAREKERLMRDIDEEVPSWISWVVKPLASWEFERGHARDAAVGWIGEKAAAFSFWAFLPSSWVVMHDVVLEPEPEEFIQADHLLVGPPGVYLIETKRWEGAFLCHNDRWKRKEGDRWVPCKSPTAQNLRHARLFRKWLNSNLSGRLTVGDWVHPVVLLVGASWLRVDGSSMPVFDSGLALAWYLRRRTGEEVLSPGDVELVAEAVAGARPFPAAAAGREKGTPASLVQVREGTTRDGRRYVVVRGGRESAEQVRRSYIDRGESAKPLRADRSGQGWFFYLD